MNLPRNREIRLILEALPGESDQDCIHYLVYDFSECIKSMIKWNTESEELENQVNDIRLTRKKGRNRVGMKNQVNDKKIE